MDEESIGGIGEVAGPKKQGSEASTRTISTQNSTDSFCKYLRIYLSFFFDILADSSSVSVVNLSH